MLSRTIYLGKLIGLCCLFSFLSFRGESGGNER